MPEVIRKILALLSPQERRQAYLLLGMILVMAILDVVGIVSIMPFMAVLANPEAVQTNAWLNSAYTTLGFTDPERFLSFLGIVVFIALVVSISFKAATTWAITHFTQMRNYSISRRLVAGYLAQPYEWFLNRHSAELGKTVLSEVQLVVQGALLPLMQLLAQGTVVVAIFLMLLAINPILALVVGGGIGGTYALIYRGLRRLLDRVGKERVVANEMRFKAVSEALGGIKEVKLGALERDVLRRFDSPAKRFATTQVTAQVVGMMPRFALEIIAFGGMLLLAFSLMRGPGSLEGALPIIALYSLSGYRIMPALQLAYSHATKVRFSGEALDRLNRDLQELGDERRRESRTGTKITPEQSISLENVAYAYPNAQRPAVAGLSLEIRSNTTVGLVGATGSGKTTTVDIILGLLEPREGALKVDGTAITGANRRAWQRSIGYVPQQIFLADETVAANIAFGARKDDIDPQAVERASKIANLHQFVVDELPYAYDTLVGERGVRLSGGQRQRIGIARALYHQPRVLILDEATSALDNLTEQAVMDAVHNLSGEITILLIAHRLTTVRECDCIFLLDGGRVAGTGSYEELLANSAKFRSMAVA